ncbi:MAG: DUF1080 domain-containing protein [Verrucomicrobia bacterium]|nr:DUF1080 domain-containing protein [Verrucomicrobiota bacterium]
MKTLALCTLISSLAFSAFSQTEPGKAVPEKPGKKGWIELFDGKTLSGWSAVDPGQWEVKDGILIGQGNVSHLFSPNTYTNMEFKAEVRTKPNANSGMYFHAERGSGWPKGYEAQVNNTYKDPQKTGGLYNFHKIMESPTKDNEWWTQHIVAIGNRTIIKVNDKVVTDYVDEKNTFKSGHLAFQQHDPGSYVEYRNVIVKRLSNDEKEALKEASKDLPELKKEKKAKSK